jgi:hypothetical protein
MNKSFLVINKQCFISIFLESATKQQHIPETTFERIEAQRLRNSASGTPRSSAGILI